MEFAPGGRRLTREGGADALAVLWFLDAAVNDDVPVLGRALAERAVAPDAADASGRTGLHAAASMGATAALRLLLQHGARPDARNGREGSTPLHMAAGRGFADCVSLLLAHGAPVSAADRAGKTPLHEAAWGGHVACLRQLLAAGSSLASCDSWGRTPLHFAVSPPHWAHAEGSAESVALLVAARAPLEAGTRGCCTPLHTAAAHGRNARVAEQLLSAGAFVGALDDKGETPLHKAALHNREDVARVLLGRGVNASVRDNGGRTARERAVEKGYLEVALVLQSGGG
eukprot:gnl/TRDRNA2_/TRDRNA2_149952_c0_seq2.p1 gnl/TRDRNA2_/TRDRNA2_149952_c0~~gnl/TRDRNA2_/TRDRNA2_149952_c0_seq2.p1  ORF type:complete len:286 (+),score=35.34 gnl/TRDRNA2_/TRDRNA2_149952_c0_seq2:31-888(+)